jgi:uncharacterized protein
MKASKTSIGSSSKSSKPALRSRTAPTRRTVAEASAKSKSAPNKRKKVSHAAAPEIPAALLEGDSPSTFQAAGPGEKFALGPTPPEQLFAAESADLPSSYGTKRLFLTARDPHWLYANWDLSSSQQQRYNKLSADKHLVLRIYTDVAGGSPVSEVHVHPESRHWFAHVERAGLKYVAELGYHRKFRNKRLWTSIATSGATLTPPDSISGDMSIEFATIPLHIAFERLVEMIKETARVNLPLAKALAELRKAGHTQLPASAAMPTSEWTEQQERALADVICMDHVRRVWIGSLEITELIRRQLEREISSIGAAQFGWPTSPGGAITSVSSPFGGGVVPPREKGFWFNINAELIIYGATEPDATVSIGGHKIKLRPDGSFSYRFALPDGRYEMPVVAVSADETDGRAADLKFTRSTEFLGDVGTHPQDPSLKPPTPENV